MRVEDILDAAGRAQRYVADIDLATFVAREDLPTIMEPLRRLLAERRS